MLNFNNEGKPLAKITDGKGKNKIICVDTEDSEGLETVTIKDNGKFQQLPNPNGREILYITGASGSGKSYYTREYCKQWLKLHSKKDDAEIYLYSSLTEDETLDDPAIKINRIKIDEGLINDPINIKDFTNCLVLFDDVDVISDKKIRAEVLKTLNQILEIGRHHNISAILTYHSATDGTQTKKILNESHCVVYFPHSGAKRQLDYLLKEYLGMSNQQILKIKRSKSRWCCVFKNYPQIAMTEKSIFLLNTDE
jgi:hypothetical protein